MRWWSLALLGACATHVPMRALSPGEEPTHDIDDRLEAVLETEKLAGACEAWRLGDDTGATRLRCGKQLFFHETFGTTGIPTSLLVFLQEHYAGYYGRGFSSLGLVADPASGEGLPVGLAPSRGDTQAFTCAACHFGRLPDGRYAVGFGNTRFEYGAFIASLGAPLLLSFDPEAPSVAPTLREALRPHVQAAQARSGYGVRSTVLGTALMMKGWASSPLGLGSQERHLKLPPGVLDFLTPPLLDDGVWAPSRVLSLWNLPTAEQRAAAGMPGEMLSWNGGIPSLEVFMQGFVAFGFGRQEPDDPRYGPLRDYVQRLRAPSPPGRRDDEGAQLFDARGCRACHAGPSGEGTRVFTFAEVGTDPEYANIYGPKPDGTACCGLDAGSPYITRGIKAPRLAGVWAASRLLHDGSVASLEALFCLEPRETPAHRQTCDGLTEAERRALLGFVRSW
ncbi:MAG: hypothetical protein JNK82_14970 [Myxococcaceae bacterium]|nr:hypothetical protein [Myxococcaceae bacterium]